MIDVVDGLQSSVLKETRLGAVTSVKKNKKIKVNERSSLE